MAIEITDWNLDENKNWWVRIADSGTDLSVELYASESNAQHQTDRNASGSAVYGTNSVCVLTADTGYSVDFYQGEYPWHLRVSGNYGDATKIYKVNAFTDIAPITHSIFRNVSLITVKSTYEINLHTHSQTVRSLPLGIHIPTLSVGEIIGMNSVRRGVNDMNQITSLTITGSTQPDGTTQLTNSLEVMKFNTLTKV